VNAIGRRWPPLHVEDVRHIQLDGRPSSMIPEWQTATAVPSFVQEGTRCGRTRLEPTSMGIVYDDERLWSGFRLGAAADHDRAWVTGAM